MSKAEDGSKNTIFTKEEYDKIMARRANNPIFQWLDQSSRGYWDFVSRVADYFPKSLRRLRNRNTFFGIAHRLFLFVAGFIIVFPLYIVIGPVVQIAIIIIAFVWLFLAGIFGWHRTPK